MTYKPTQEELEELGFNQTIYGYFWKQLLPMCHTLKCYPEYDEWIMVVEGDMEWDEPLYINIYPQSKDDLDTLIRLFTNPNE